MTKLIRVNEREHLVITPVARVAFPQLFVARSFQDQEGQKKEFKLDLIFDSADVLKAPGKSASGPTVSLAQALQNVKVAQWGADKSRWPNFDNTILKRGDERVNKSGEVYQGYEGKVFITAKSGEKFPPRVMLADGSPATEKDIYGGCYVQAAIVVRPYIFGKNQGLRLQLAQVKKVRDGERFGGISADLFETDSAFGSGDQDDSAF